MTRIFVRLPEFEKNCKDIGLDEDDIREIELTLLGNPTIGDLIKGTGGIRKVRIALPNRGKSGGARAIYLDFAHYEKTYFITVYDKAETDDLTKAEKNELKTLSKFLENELRKKVKK
jgi:hypothetical protein